MIVDITPYPLGTKSMRSGIPIAAGVAAVAVAVAAAAMADSSDSRPSALAGVKAPAGETEQKGDTEPVGSQKPDNADAKNSAQPACRMCGGSCGLEPVCVCEPSTKKRPKTTYSMKCESVCVPAPCLVPGGHGHHHAPACTGVPGGGGCSNAVVRTKKSLLKTVTEEEVDVVVRKVEHICRHCSGIDVAGSCLTCTTPGPAPWQRRPWWPWSWPWHLTP